MTDFWIGSREWGRWWDPEPATVLHAVETDGPQEIVLVELERTGERVLIGRHTPAAVASGRAVGVHVYDVPDGWDERSPLRERDLRFTSEPGLDARADEAPVVTAEEREWVRRGWA